MISSVKQNLLAFRQQGGDIEDDEDRADGLTLVFDDSLCVAVLFLRLYRDPLVRKQGLGRPPARRCSVGRSVGRSEASVTFLFSRDHRFQGNDAAGRRLHTNDGVVDFPTVLAQHRWARSTLLPRPDRRRLGLANALPASVRQAVENTF